MKYLAVLLAVPTVFGNILVERQATRCNADNCARAVTGTQAGLTRSSSRVLTDCSSFQLATAYPAPITTTITSEVASTTTILANPASATTVTASSIPSYVATACGPAASAAARFASACSCASVLKSTTTVAAPTATVIVPPTAQRPAPQCNDPYNVYTGGSATGCTGGVRCVCLEHAGSPNGQGACGDDGPANCDVYPPCDADADCPAGSFCSDRNACRGGRGVCLVFSQCASAAAPGRLFRDVKRQAGHGAVP